MCPLPAFLTTVRKSNRFAGFDPTAITYIQNVEAADGQQLELGVINALNDFIKGLKDELLLNSDPVNSIITSMCVLAGARTVSGALVPIVGPQPTGYSFQPADYNRKTGLIGDLTGNKYIDTNFNHADSTSHPTDSRHCAVLVTESHAGSLSAAYIGRGRDGQTGSTRILVGSTDNAGMKLLSVNSAQLGISNDRPSGFFGLVRSEATGYREALRKSGTTAGTNVETARSGYASQTPSAGNYWVFKADATSGASNPNNGRIAFYCIGKGFGQGFNGLAKIDARVGTLMTSLGSAIT